MNTNKETCGLSRSSWLLENLQVRRVTRCLSSSFVGEGTESRNLSWGVKRGGRSKLFI